jgi:hypothetical protein
LVVPGEGDEVLSAAIVAPDFPAAYPPAVLPRHLSSPHTQLATEVTTAGSEISFVLEQ